MSEMTDIVSDVAVRFAAVEGAHRHALPSARSQDTALPLPEPAVQPVMPGQTTQVVHLASLPDRHVAGMVGTLCGTVLRVDDRYRYRHLQPGHALHYCAFSTT